MSPDFNQYARYYDLLYRDKNYAEEAVFIDRLLRRFGGAGGTLLDVGCGTGAHARELASLGWRVTGVDRSATMIELARSKTISGSPIEFCTAAAADFDLGRLFPTAISLFHVASYQIEEGDLQKMFENVRRHLSPRGLFLFDFWHGPGVRLDPPVIRVRRLENEHLRITRIAEPEHLQERSTIEVNYEIFVENRQSGVIERIRELHRMRYFFLPEIEALLRKSGFVVEQTRADLTDAALADEAWYASILARAA
ncbi:MAG: class I SAM-dependent methyltransferase [Opitutaceae bacterium]